MTLTLEIIAAPGVKSADLPRQTFGPNGGTIGRAPGSNTWVLSHNKVSGRHARISFQNGVFYIHDTSRNGVSINTPDNRVGHERSYALKAGDRILIEPYEIQVMIDAGWEAGGSAGFDELGDADPFGVSRRSADQREPDAMAAVVPGGEVDPLKFLDAPPGPPAPVRRAADPASASDEFLQQHLGAPLVADDPLLPSPAPQPAVPPEGYNPAEDSAILPMPVRPRPAGRSAISPEARAPFAGMPPASSSPVPIEPTPFAQPVPSFDQRPVAPSSDPFGPVVPDDPRLPQAVPSEPFAVKPSQEPLISFDPHVPLPESPLPPPPQAVKFPDSGSRDPLSERYFAELLKGAGLRDVPVTPELMQSFGRILKVVVAGVMDVLQSRQGIKQEFRMHQTVFQQAANNPLKFSANVDDALHNLLVKRNAAYLSPVEAFGDAFEDIRSHQLAMLEGMRIAFQAMLAEFDPDRLQEQFDRQLSKGGLALVPARVRYWEMFRERRREIVKDPEDAFSRLFGEAFAEAYEEQFRRLRARRQGD